jgi:hypothetical protein
LEKITKFPITAMFTTEIPSDVNYWERRGFSNPFSAKQFAELVSDSLFSEHIKKLVFALYGRWIVFGIGMGIPRYEFLEKYGPYYDELCKKVGGVYLEGIEDFTEFLMSDWIPEMGMVIFTDSIEEESNELADIKNKLMEVSQSVPNRMLSDLFLKIEERYLALSPLYAKASDIFEVAKLCDTVSENCIKNIYLKKKLGSLAMKTLGSLIRELQQRGNLPGHLNLRLHRVLYYRNKIEHYDLIDPTEYEFTMIDLKTILTDMLTIAKYSLAEKGS